MEIVQCHKVLQYRLHPVDVALPHYHYYSNAVGVLAWFIANPGLAHWNAVKHLFHYLKGTAHFALTCGPDPSSSGLFTTFSDADHGGCKDSGCSTGAYVGGQDGHWCCLLKLLDKLQGRVSQSTTEAEYIAAVEAGKEIVWLHNLLEEMGFSVSSPSILHTDNQSAIQVAQIQSIMDTRCSAVYFLHHIYPWLVTLDSSLD